MDYEAKLLSVPEFAKALSVTPACVRRWLLQRKIAKVKLGRLVRIPGTEVNRLIARGLQPAGTIREISPDQREMILKVARKHLARRCSLKPDAGSEKEEAR